MSDRRNDWFGAPGQPPSELPPRSAPAAVPSSPPTRPPAAPLAVAPLETEMMRLPDRGRRRKVVIAIGGAAVVLALVIGVRATRHAPRLPAPKPVAAPAPPATPARGDEMALDPGGSASPAPSGPVEREAAPATDETPRARHRLHEHPKVNRRTPHHASRSANERTLAKSERKPKPAGDREAAHAAYQRGNSELLSGNDAVAAVAAYQEAVRLAPRDPSGYRGLGLAYETQGKIPDAIAAFVSYLKLSKHAHDREVIARRLYRLTHPHEE